MAPPEVWGPAVWFLFHTLAEKVSEPHFNKVYLSLFNMIKFISKNLPCPQCSSDATSFLAKINITTISCKKDFKDMLFVFHNYVNKKKHKPPLPFQDLDALYKCKDLSKVISNFLNKYNTKGNMQLLNESFHRKLIIVEFFKWIKKYAPFFNWAI